MLNRLKRSSRAQVVVALAALAALGAVFEALRRLGNLKLYVVEAIALALAAGVIYVAALYALEHTREHRAAFWLVLAGAVLFRALLAPLPPTLSTDINRYRWDGLVQQAGYNPYTVPPDDPRLEPLREKLGPGAWAGMPGQETPTIYPPLTQLVFQLTWRWLPGPVAFKLPFLLADLLVVLMLAGWVRATGGRACQVAIYAWNPLVVVEFAASGHNDALAIAGVVAAVVIIRRSESVSTWLLTAAALAKAFPAVLLPLWLRRVGWPRARGWLIGLGAIGLAAICAWPYRGAWPRVLDVLTYYESRWQNNNASLYTLIGWFTQSTAVAAGVGVGVVGGLALWAAARRLEPARAAYLLIGATLLLAPNGYSWYFTWIVPVLCFLPELRTASAWLLLTVLQFLSYNVLIDFQATGRWHFDPVLQWLTYGPFFALLIGQGILRRRAKENGY